MNRFLPLLRREWLQHRTGWLVLLALPTLLMLALAASDGAVHLRVNGGDTDLPALREAPALMQTVGWTVTTAAGTFLLAAVAVLFQLPGLARRDMQDRSIEFWRSLPCGDAESVAATLLMHLLVLPVAAFAAGALGAQLVALLSISLSHGPLAWLQQPWWVLLPALAAALARGLFGWALALLWLSPLLLLTMAASAWLKRWGVPVLVIASIAGTQLLDPRLPRPLVQPALERLGQEALGALLAARTANPLQLDRADDLRQALPALPGWLLHDAGQALAQAATPAFLLALAGGAAGFALLVARRRRVG